MRKELAAELAKTGDFGDEDAAKIAQWNPYDQNAAAQWFDAEYMFGVRDGFDIVIGNPPYNVLEKGTKQEKDYVGKDPQLSLAFALGGKINIVSRIY